MNWLALSLVLASQPAPPPPVPWRVVARPDLHVGVRPALLVSSDELGVGVSVQVSVRWP